MSENPEELIEKLNERLRDDPDEEEPGIVGLRGKKFSHGHKAEKRLPTPYYCT
jgi:hypothetical protein